jgi:hypothetical protein
MSKRGRSVTVSTCGSPPTKSEEHEMEGVSFSSLRTDREKMKYIKFMAGKKIKVRGEEEKRCMTLLKYQVADRYLLPLVLSQYSIA